MKNFLFASFVFLTIQTGYTQMESSSFTSTGRGGATTFATDYQAIGINPANLGWEYKFDGKKVAFGLTEMAYSLHSEALSKDDLRNSFREMINGNGDKFTYNEKIEAAENFAQTGLAFNADLGSFGIAYMDEKLGGIGFRINDKIQFYSMLGPTASDLFFKGRTSNYFDLLTYVDTTGLTNDTTIIANNGNLSADSAGNVISGQASIPLNFSELFANSQISMSWTREYNLSYGRKLVGLDSTFMLYGGVGVKFVQGLALLDMESDGNTLTAFSAASPVFGIDYGTAANTNPSAITTPNNGFMPDPVGKGWGFDIGFNAIIKNKLKIGFSVTNIGSITWDGNVYSAKDTLLFDTENEGLNSYNVVNQLGDLVGDEGVFSWNGLASKKVNLPTMFRAGASLRFNDKIELGCDLLLPTNTVPGSLEGAMFGFGADITPVRWLNLSGGFVTGGNYDFQIPLGITLISKNGSYEMGVASRDAITFFTQNGPTLSLSMGFMRFRF
ncbi:DUF5723 family protein [Flavobacteriales bacterium]|nr:DUF5723 family protein [Flavobacteriales bacterium]